MKINPTPMYLPPSPPCAHMRHRLERTAAEAERAARRRRHQGNRPAHPIQPQPPGPAVPHTPLPGVTQGGHPGARVGRARRGQPVRVASDGDPEHRPALGPGVDHRPVFHGRNPRGGSVAPGAWSDGDPVQGQVAHL